MAVYKTEDFWRGQKNGPCKPRVCVIWILVNEVWLYLTLISSKIGTDLQFLNNILRPIMFSINKVVYLYDELVEEADVELFTNIYLRRRRRLCFWCGLFVCLFVCLSVCLSVCPSDYSQTCERILTKFFGGVGYGSGTKWYNFGGDPDHASDPGVQSPKSGSSGSAEVCALWAYLLVSTTVIKYLKPRYHNLKLHIYIWMWFYSQYARHQSN